MKWALPLIIVGAMMMQNTVSLSNSSELENANYVVQNISGEWAAMSAGLNDRVWAVVVASDGTAFIGGQFSGGGGPEDYITSWDGAAFNALGDGVDDYVYAAALGPGDVLYVGGVFANAGGSAAVRVASWNGTAWSALGAGVDDTVYALAVGLDGTLYAGGAFHNAGGGAAAHVAKWTGSAWAALGTGVDDVVYALAVGPDGTLYAGGALHNAGGSAAAHIAKWNGTAWSVLGAGVNNVVKGLFVAPDGRLYANGIFTTAGSVAAVGVAVWNGTAWSALGSGVTGTTAKTLAHLAMWQGELVTTGMIDGTTARDRIVSWNGSRWAYLDIDLPNDAVGNGAELTAIAVDPTGERLYLGFDGLGSATVSAVTASAVITNAGTADASPVFHITRTGGTSATLESIRNLTTGAQLLFDWDLLSGDPVTIDLRTGTVTSKFLGNAMSKSAGACDFAAFKLIPGENILSVYVSTAGSPTIEAVVQWNNAYVSAMGAAS